METLQVDGLALLPELTDDAVLTSNLLTHSIHGRPAIVRFIKAVLNYCTSVADIERLNTPSHLVVESRALLPSGQKVAIMAIGMRDTHGWIADVFVEYQSDKPLDALAEIVENAIR